MLRVTAHLPANHGKGKPFDRLTLTHDQRRLRRKLLTLPKGEEIMVDFPDAVTLEHFGGLQLEDGRIVEIVAAPEPLYEVSGRGGEHLSQLAWHIGNRHMSAQIEKKRILIPRDHVAAHHAARSRRRSARSARAVFARTRRLSRARRALMTDAAALQKLLTWLSPAFPVGAFAWSQGLETAIADDRVHDATTLKDWVGGSLAHGGLKTDAILLAHAHLHANDADAVA